MGIKVSLLDSITQKIKENQNLGFKFPMNLLLMCTYSTCECNIPPNRQRKSARLLVKRKNKRPFDGGPTGIQAITQVQARCAMTYAIKMKPP